MKPWVAKHAPLAAFAALALGLGVAYGIETDRWRSSRELDAALARLPAVPAAVGDWVGTDLPFNLDEVASAGIRGAVFRRYRNTRTGAAVTVLLVCGQGGPISVHTPDICYAAAGYKASGVPSRKVVPTGPDGETAAAWTLQFAKPDATLPDRLQIYWGWFREGSFEAPEGDARFAYGRAPALVKMYVIREFVPNSRADKENACEQFIRRALPEFRAALAAPAGPAS